jgi:chromosome segregation ATPase
MTSPDPIKDAFLRVRQDIDELKAQNHDLKTQILLLNQQIDDINRTLQAQIPTENLEKPAIQQINPTIQHIPTDNSPLYASETPNMGVSIGNRGVPTDRQADSQSNQQIPQKGDFLAFHPEESHEFQEILQKQDKISQKPDAISQIDRVSQVLASLDDIKKEIRSNFKHLTSQEMSVFSTIYTFEEQGFVVDYSLISQKLGLSESSIRDYTHKLIKKGIPILKSKENNKKVTLQISPDLKKIASLQTILALRQL